MPNVNGPFGFLPVDRGYGGAPVITASYAKASGTPSIYKGDVVTLNSSAQLAASTAAGNYHGVAQHGVRTGRAQQILIYPDHRQRYLAQVDTFAVVDGGQNALISFDLPSVTDWTAQTFVDRSNMSLNSKATTNTHDFKLDILHDGSLNEAGAYAVVECFFNRSFFALQGTGV